MTKSAVRRLNEASYSSSIGLIFVALCITIIGLLALLDLAELGSCLFSRSHPLKPNVARRGKLLWGRAYNRILFLRT